MDRIVRLVIAIPLLAAQPQEPTIYETIQDLVMTALSEAGYPSLITGGIEEWERAPKTTPIEPPPNRPAMTTCCAD